MPPKREIGEVDQEKGSIYWSLHTVARLKAELGNRGLTKSGNKAALVDRLVVHIGSRDGQLPDPTTIAGPNDVASDAGPSSTAPASTAPASTVPISSGSQAKPKAKRAKKEKSPDFVVEAPLATEMIIHQHRNYATGEARLREFVPEPDAPFKAKLKKIRKERMFMLDRKKGVDRDGYPQEHFDIAGSSGNIYEVTIGRQPKCVCMDAVSHESSTSDEKHR